MNMYVCCTHAGQIQLLSCQKRKLVPHQTRTIRLTASIPRPQKASIYHLCPEIIKKQFSAKLKNIWQSSCETRKTHMNPCVCSNDEVLLKVWSRFMSSKNQWAKLTMHVEQWPVFYTPGGIPTMLQADDRRTVSQLPCRLRNF
jgi:hypothetical protein